MLTYSLTQAPAGATINASTGVVSWSTTAIGSYSFSVKASDGRGGSATQTFTLTVKVPNNAPVANADSVTVNEDNTARINVLANDTDADGNTLTASVVTGPQNGTLIRNADGTFSYTPMAHMVWFWMGPDAYATKAVVDAMNAKAGLIWQWGALDFAGGTVVHINAAMAGLVGAYVIGKRTGYGREAMAPHSLTLTMVGAALLWVGWFGFNAGSALEANGTAVLAFMNTFSATAAAVLAWCIGEAMMKGKASMLGATSGAVAGLVAITPACGNVGLMGAMVVGSVAGFACLWGVNGLKKILGADDSLDVFGVHGVGGIVGALLTGVFNNQALGGPGLVSDWVAVTVSSVPIMDQVWIQLKAVLLTIVWSGVVSLIAYKIADLVIGLRVSEEDEREGLDITSHGETAYSR